MRQHFLQMQSTALQVAENMLHAALYLAVLQDKLQRRAVTCVISL